MTDNIPLIKKDQIYTPLGDKGHLRSRIERHILVICPRSYLLGCFDRSGKLLAYSGATGASEDWASDFYEENLALEPLLLTPNHQLSLFIAPAKAMLVPRALYKTETASNWFDELYFRDGEDHLCDYALPGEKIHFLYAFPEKIHELMNRILPAHETYPLSAGLFNRPQAKEGHRFDCLLTQKQLFVNQYNGGNLLGHFYFSASQPEEMAYRIHQAIEFHQWSEYTIHARTTLLTEDPKRWLEISRYFPDAQLEGIFGDADSSHTGTEELLERLLLCV